jgi:hypothetical protein
MLSALMQHRRAGVWAFLAYWFSAVFNYVLVKVKVQESRNRPGVAQRIPGDLGSQISMTLSTLRWWGCQPHAPAAFTPRKCSCYSFSLGAESTPGHWWGRKEYVNKKSSDNTENRSRDRPISSAARLHIGRRGYKYREYQLKGRK